MDENADQQDNNTIEQTNQTDGSDDATAIQQHEDAAPVSKETSSLGQQQATTRSVNQATSAEKTQEVQTKNRQYASKYDADPRIRTGAYAITGIAQTVTVRPGQTLSSISRAYLGPGMECYMEAVNDKAELKEMCIRDSPYMLQYLANIYEEKKDTTMYLKVLDEGFTTHPSFPFFFPRLVDYYVMTKQFDNALGVLSLIHI